MRVEIPNTVTAAIGGLISRGVKAAEITDEGRLVFTLTDGSTADLGSVVGPKGEKGETGARGPKGDTGAKGETGAAGAQGPKGETGERGPKGETGAQGPKGDTGAQGPKGDTGEGFRVQGYYATAAALEASVQTPAAGDAYGVGASEPYEIYIFDGVTGSWINNGPLQGARGEKGDKGDPGADGQKGETGAQGPKGEPGPEGPQGPAGKTPVKGTDYFTEADKQEIAEDAAALVDLSGKQNKITASGILKGDGAGGVSAAVPGTDYLAEAPVASVNGKTGAVALAKGDIGLSQVDNVRQYSAQNPPPYPVTSVNGKTGAVTVREVPSVTASDNGKSAVVVNGAWAAVDKTPFYVSCTISGYGVYDENLIHDKTYAEILAAYQAGRPCYAILKNSAGTKIITLPLTDLHETAGAATFALTQMIMGDVPNVIWAAYVEIEEDFAEGYYGERYTMPVVTTSDNGKFMRVVNGDWKAETVPDANGVSF